MFDAQLEPEFGTRLPTSPGELAHSLALGAEAERDFARYAELLAEWNGRMNLVGPSAMAEFWPRHAYDGAQLLQLAPEAVRWADLGTGAGLPGLVLAIALKGRPGSEVLLVESLAKRCRFLQAVVDELALPARVLAGRAEALSPPPVEVVTARAVAPLTRLLGFARPFLKGGAQGLFLKGRGAEAELAEARQAWRFDAECLPSRTDPDGRIIRVRRLARA